ncbi:MAG: lipid IV(A) palmitoyltransferase PagP [Alphaproteobacteria bacterium]|nr:lipid IV(A) palmitoyltransferase PagP [Alphaproteobacteria bacterium]
MKILKLFIITTIFILLSNNVQAFSLGQWFSNLKENIIHAFKCGNTDAYVPVRTWHNRLFYDKEKIKKYNEEPWGFGIGRSFTDGREWHGIYAMAFKDSNFYTETFIGYGYQYNWSLFDSDHWKIGAGYTLGLTQRHEYSYVPIPVPLPVGSISYKNLSLQAAYVPGVKNNGNVLFAWLRISF